MASADRFRRWYDPEQPDELHKDLRENFLAARELVNKRPSLVKHFEQCPVCKEIEAEKASGPSPMSTRNRLKFLITPAQMHQLLGLPTSHEIVFMFSTPDPNTVQVIVAGADLPEVIDGHETPTAGASLLPRAA